MPNDELAKILASPPDDWDQLARSVPVVPDDGYAKARALHEWVTRNALDPARYAGFYPLRVMSRYFDPQGQSSFYNPQGTPYRLEQLKPSYEAIAKAGVYEPGQRESTNIEDRRPRSIWDY